MCPQESSVSRLQPAACVFQQPRAKEFLGADGSSWFCTASWLPLGFPFPRLPCRRSMLQVQDSPLCTQHSPGRGLHPGVGCGPQILTGKDPVSWGEAAPHPPHRHLCPGEGTGTRLDGHWRTSGVCCFPSCLFPRCPAPPPLPASPGGLVRFQLNWSHCSPSAARTSCVHWACLPPFVFLFLSKSLSL